MHPVLIHIPGLAFKLFAPAIALWGIVGFVRELARKRVPAGNAAADGANETPGPTRGGVASLFYPYMLLVAFAAYAYGAPVRPAPGSSRFAALLRGVASPAVWSAPWRSLPIYAYGTMLGIAIISGWYLGHRLVRRYKMTDEHYVRWSLFAAGSALVGARVLYILTNLSEFSDPVTHRLSPGMLLQLQSNGLVAYGGFLGGLIGSIAFFRLHGYRLWPLVDVAAPTLASGLMVTRLGCYLYGCDFGRPLSADAPRWLARSGTFPQWRDHAGSPAWLQHRARGFAATADECARTYGGAMRDGLCHLGATAPASAPVHPTQLYESATGLVLFVVTMWLWRRKRFDGQVFLAFAVLYGLARTALESVRDDPGRGALGSLSTSQIIGLSTAAIAAGLYAWRARRAPGVTGTATVVTQTP